jgi:hypothetical protein
MTAERDRLRESFAKLKIAIDETQKQLGVLEGV